jgi:hypothetical protein
VAAFSTLARIFNDTEAPSVKVRETADAIPRAFGDILQRWRIDRVSIVRPYTAGPLLISAQNAGSKARISDHFATGCKMG